MTLIVGAKCDDGIVLVGDTKITIDEGADFSHAKKIFMPFNNIIVGSSGMSGLFRDFQARLKVEVANLQESKKESGNINWHEEMILLTGRVIRNMGDEYGNDIVNRHFQAFVALRAYYEPELLKIGVLGIPQPVTKYDAIGHGEPYTSVILKILWEKLKPRRMEDFAKIGCLAIRYVQDLELDFSVGVDHKNNDYPQVWYLPQVSPSGITQLEKAENPEAESQIWGLYNAKELNKELIPKPTT